LNDPSNSQRPVSAIVVIGAGLAGAEAAWQAAQRGVHVVLYEMRPQRMTPAHETGGMAELVCSNSLGSSLPDRALGLLKNELRRMGSLNIACADATAVPAGDALAVDRAAFSRAVTEAIEGHPNIEVRREEVVDLPPSLFPSQGDGKREEGSAPLVVATGPLTSQPLAEAIRALAGQDHLYFFDAMAPIVTAESIDMGFAWRGNRWSRPANQRIGESANQRTPALAPERSAGASVGESADEGQPSSVVGPSSSVGDYINCPLSRDEYYAFVDAVNQAEKISLREFELDPDARRYFEACLPIEVLAARGPDALAFGPMTPMGLRDPRTGRRPYAAVQLRQDNLAGTLYNLVGFQTNLKWGDQERVLRLIPGLARAEFVRFGQMHRNTYINSPTLLRPTLQWRDWPDLFFAGQITGTEGYVGSTMSGLLAGVNAARVALGHAPLSLPPTTMAGALLAYITHADPKTFQPMKANFGLLPELESPVKDKRMRHAAYAARAMNDLEAVLKAEM
jgi:methylenetetrahydrofolate--tRNA-(uracil-5-)-methyltransferase